MRKLLLAGIAFGALIAPAIAADMPIKAPAYVPPLAWSGFYAGLNAGYAAMRPEKMMQRSNVARRTAVTEFCLFDHFSV
jgi:opacity protein-like surface antigen